MSFHNQIGVFLFLSFIFFTGCEQVNKPKVIESQDQPSDSIRFDKNTGLIVDEGMNQVVANCTACHGPSLINQNRASREGWLQLIRWMQKTQNLWDLGVNETIILDYLAKNYAPEETGRRKNLENIEWYVLEE